MNVPHAYSTNRETATLLALSKRTFHRYISEGTLKAHRVAEEKAIRIKLESLISGLACGLHTEGLYCLL
jgi:excisionase family DNA binding protein